jgi:hypothetical protein
MSKASILVSFLVVVCLLGGVRCVQWQAAANISAANHTLIWSTINAGLTTYVPNAGSSTGHSDLAQYISDSLNAAYDPAWNVFVFELVGDPTLDAVVVGYAFRDHWMWFNGYSYLGRTFSFIIWKDYNCIAWVSIDNTVMNGAASTNILGVIGTNAIRSSLIAVPYDDIWGFGQSLINRLYTSTSAFTIIAFQKPVNAANSIIGAGRFCTLDSGSYASFPLTRNYDGTDKTVGLLLFVTRNAPS